MPTKSRASTQAWTFGGTSDARPEAGAARVKPIALVKPLVFAAALLPLAALVRGFYLNDLTANPGDYITDQTGTWTLACLFASLAVTPIRRLTGWNDIIKLRRMLGLFAFFYVALHLSTWIVFVHYFEVGFMVEDVVKRPFITVGMAAFLILLALAVTSNRFSIRKLARRWQSLHRLAYVAAVAGVVHFWWLVKADTTEPVRWAVGLSILLGIRAWWTFRKRALSRS
jgi:sulfoxide reductase heme-binding subunit YedZ